MKANPLLTVSFILGVFLRATGLAQGQVVGYANVSFQVGDNLAGNPLWAYPTNDLTLLLAPPDGTTVSFWNPATRSFDRSSTYTAGQGWSEDFAWNPGEGVLLHAATNFLETFAGSWLAPDGSFLTLDQADGRAPLPMPPPFSGPSGLYLLSCKSPVGLKSPTFPVFQWVIGRGPLVGEQFTWLVASNQTYYTTTYTGTNWDNGEPWLPAGGAAFFNLIGVPSLRIAGVSNQVVISWPAWATNYTLETSSIQSPAAGWFPVMDTSTTASNSVTLKTSAASAFYRLRKL
jgi:hypothetical protein